MMSDVDTSPETWSIVRDQEHRYSVWSNDKALPVGWSKESFSGTREECLSEIKKIWVDPRPLALRQAMA
ncbi:MbtH family NRPS accessory protein [Phyllobacterium sp. TAF24]|uniref:MbtH family NRPS accessory protein n=1 Tax=unclassified Phyllobacterium TaxID=2638441 RepID=UPI00088E8B2C|nr:MbtH family NRPS accessory protein [Phyllobacterium sp. OV277]SDP49794.1 MbtH protein [Phyllobacterium sp. OV277]